MLQDLEKHYQITVIGGGINGAGVAREAAARGYTTLLTEKSDFSNATTSQSSKLIHGGIRYLEHGRISLVRESLKERKILLQTAPHLVHPIRINIPIYRGDKRPAWMIWLGCKMYDLLAGEKNLPPSRWVKKEKIEKGAGLRTQGLKAALSYSDGQAFDSRLAVEIVLSAQSYGATVRNYLRFVSAKHQNDGYLVTLFDKRTGKHMQVTTDFLVNAAGPWALILDNDISTRPNRPKLKFIRGIHFVIPSIHCKSGFLMLPADGRIVFVLPWLKKYTLIGTTESVFEGNDFDKIPVSREEIDYLLNVFNYYFPDNAISLDNVKFMYSGVRTLIDKGETEYFKMSREYRIEKELLSDRSGYIALFGGKLTTYRSLACKVLEKIAPHVTPEKDQHIDTSSAPLFGGFSLPAEIAETYYSQLQKAGVEQTVIDRWKEFYGSQWIKIADYALEDARYRETIVFDFFLRAELHYLVDVEQAYELEDVIFRRSKLIYELDKKGKEIVQEALDSALSQNRSGFQKKGGIIGKYPVDSHFPKSPQILS